MALKVKVIDATTEAKVVVHMISNYEKFWVFNGPDIEDYTLQDTMLVSRFLDFHKEDVVGHDGTVYVKDGKLVMPLHFTDIYMIIGGHFGQGNWEDFWVYLKKNDRPLYNWVMEQTHNTIVDMYDEVYGYTDNGYQKQVKELKKRLKV